MANISLEEAKKRLGKLSGWQLDSHAIAKEFTFKDFKQAFEFMSRCAVLAEDMRHHPEWTNNYNKVAVRLTTHSAQGLTELDFELAHKMNRAWRDLV